MRIMENASRKLELVGAPQKLVRCSDSIACFMDSTPIELAEQQRHHLVK
jgi:hypothetical protein